MANDDLKLVTNGKFSLQATNESNVFYFYRNDGEPIGNANTSYLGNKIDYLYKTYISHKYDDPFDINKRVKFTTKESTDGRMIIVKVTIED